MLAWLTVAFAAASEKAQAKSGLPQFSVPDMAPQLIWLALTFGCLYLVLSRRTLPTIASIIEERKARIQGDLDEAERFKSEADQAIAAYEQKLAEAQAHAKSIANDMHEKLDVEVAEQRSNAEAEVARQLAEAQERIEAAKSQAVEHIDTIASVTVGEVVKKLVGVEIDQTEIGAAIAMQQSSAGE